MPADAGGATQLRVALVLGPSTGGIGRHVAALAVQLAERGHTVTVCGPRPTLDRLPLDVAGVEIVAMPVGAAKQAGPHLSRLRRTLTGHDVVHAHGVRAGAQVALAGARPLVITWHNAPLGGPVRRSTHVVLEQVGARRSDAVIGASPDLVERARRAGARRAVFCPVVAPSLPPASAPAPDVAGAGSPVVLAVARLHPQKRLDLLVRATAGWQGRPDRVRVLVAGEGPARSELVRLARRLGSPLELLGDRTDVAALLGAATVVVLPSDWEGWPFVAQETLRAGVPLVATAVGGLPLLAGDAALLVGKGDVGALTVAIERVLTDADLRHRLSAAGPRQAAQWLTQEEMVDRILRLYLDVGSRDIPATPGAYDEA